MRKLTTEEFINKAKDVHGENYGYGGVNYIKASAKVNIFCPTHGDFKQRANSHLDGTGCPKCGKIKRK